MKMNVTIKPVYPEIEILGKTYDSHCGTIDRRLIGRNYITTETVPPEGLVLVEDGSDKKTELKQVAGPADVEVFVELVGGMKSLASFKFFAAYTADNKENPGVVEVYTKDKEKVAAAEACAQRMLDSHPECDGQFKFVLADGRRAFLRVYSDELDENGWRKDWKPSESSPCDTCGCCDCGPDYDDDESDESDEEV